MEKMNIPFSPPDISDAEIANVVKVLESGWITTGPQTKNFEKEISTYCQTNKTICLNSATACMEMCLRMLGIGEGDEVITSAYTYTASASVIDHVGAKIVLVDTKKDSYHLSYEELEKAITPNTKAIIAVDVAGVMCDYDDIFKVVEGKRHLFQAKNEMQKCWNRVVVIADAAHSLGAMYKGKMCGSVADFTSFSFHAVKNLTTGEGGALTWKSLGENIDEKIYKTINTLSLHGQTKDALAKNQIGAWEYDIIIPAYKCNMTDVQAAMGRTQLERYGGILARRREIIATYSKGLPEGMKALQHPNTDTQSSAHLYLTRVDGIEEKERNEIITKLAECGISTNVHYKPLPLLTAYKNLGFKIEYFPNAFAQYQNEITLPLYTRLTNEEVEYIICCLGKVLGEKN